MPVEDWAKQPDGKTGIPDGLEGPELGQSEVRLPDRHAGRPQGDPPQERERQLDDLQGDEGRRQGLADPPVELAGGDPAQGRRRPQVGDRRRGGQIYVTFPRFPSAVRSRIISYIWDTTAPVGSVFKSEKTGLVTYVVVRSGPADLGKWLTESRNVLRGLQEDLRGSARRGRGGDLDRHRLQRHELDRRVLLRGDLLPQAVAHEERCNGCVRRNAAPAHPGDRLHHARLPRGRGLRSGAA